MFISSWLMISCCLWHSSYAAKVLLSVDRSETKQRKILILAVHFKSTSRYESYRCLCSCYTQSYFWLFFILFQGNTSNPKVLLTHIPLYRPDNTPCGPHRSSPVINQVLSCFYKKGAYSVLLKKSVGLLYMLLLAIRCILSHVYILTEKTNIILYVAPLLHSIHLQCSARFYISS